MSKPCKKPASDCLFAPWYFLAKQFKDHGLWRLLHILNPIPGFIRRSLLGKQQEDL